MLHKQNSFVASLMQSLTNLNTSRMAMSEQSLFACLEITRFAFLIPPSSNEEEPSLRTLGVKFAIQLKVRLYFQCTQHAIDASSNYE